MSYRHISQREAREMRRDLKALRRFVARLRYSVGAGIPIGNVSLCDLSRGRIEGVRGVARMAVLVCVPDFDGNIGCYAHVPPPEATE